MVLVSTYYKNVFKPILRQPSLDISHCSWRQESSNSLEIVMETTQRTGSSRDSWQWMGGWRCVQNITYCEDAKFDEETVSSLYNSISSSVFLRCGRLVPGGFSVLHHVHKHWLLVYVYNYNIFFALARLHVELHYCSWMDGSIRVVESKFMWRIGVKHATVCQERRLMLLLHVHKMYISLSA